MQIKGYVEKIIYTNSDNGHTILDVSLTSEVDFLRLVLPRNGSGIFVAFPNSAFQPYRRCGGYRLGYCLPIIIIFLRLGKQKHIFIAARRSVPRAFRHGVSLVPNDRTSQIPTVAPQGKGYKPRNTN